MIVLSIPPTPIAGGGGGGGNASPSSPPGSTPLVEPTHDYVAAWHKLFNDVCFVYLYLAAEANHLKWYAVDVLDILLLVCDSRGKMPSPTDWRSCVVVVAACKGYPVGLPTQSLWVRVPATPRRALVSLGQITWPLIVGPFWSRFYESAQAMLTYRSYFD